MQQTGPRPASQNVMIHDMPFSHPDAHLISFVLISSRFRHHLVLSHLILYDYVWSFLIIILSHLVACRLTHFASSHFSSLFASSCFLSPHFILSHFLSACFPLSHLHPSTLLSKSDLVLPDAVSWFLNVSSHLLLSSLIQYLSCLFCVVFPLTSVLSILPLLHPG